MIASSSLAVGVRSLGVLLDPEWLYEARSDEICGRHETIVRASRRLYMTIANLVKVDG